METENMIAVETTGMSSEIKEQNEKHEKFVAREFLFFSLMKKEKGRKYEKQKGGEIRIK